MSAQKTPIEVVQALLSNPTNLNNVTALVSPTATYQSLSYDNPYLLKVLPYAGVHPGAGPAQIHSTFVTVNKIWKNEEFTVRATFGSGEDVAVFGDFVYRSQTLGKTCKSPFSVWCKVKDEGEGLKVVYMQFMEDTMGTTNTFKVDGEGSYGKYIVDPDTREEFDV